MRKGGGITWEDGGYFEKVRFRLDFVIPDGFKKGEWKMSRANWLLAAMPLILMFLEKISHEATGAYVVLGVVIS